MQKICDYHFTIRGLMDEDYFNADSPIRIDLISSSHDASLFTIHTDQPGAIGLIRHLHRQGYLLLSLIRETTGPVPRP